MHEAWTIVSAIAAVTERVEIGTLVLCSSFRSPGLVAKMAATADEVSGGRVILGLGAGWHDPEYRAFGFPSDHRVDRFEEALQIIVPLLHGETVTLPAGGTTRRGTRFSLPLRIAASPCSWRRSARGCSGSPPVTRTPDTARFGAPDDLLRERLATFRAAIEAEGRDPAALTVTVGDVGARSGARRAGGRRRRDRPSAAPSTSFPVRSTSMQPSASAT